ncbi:MAG: Uncharacterized protein G01um101413_748 [Parcubacteria group bacterium Gr01-1014_13]|nr:MAG: Uncharacterized protein G01um101413_748 [Parcubacteria group bacterium Gr01-1014_13]
MARFADHQKALTLRKEGMSYSQIKNILKIGKGTLSHWLQDYPLSKERIKELRDGGGKRIEKYRETMRQKRGARLKVVYESQKKILLPLNKRELLIAGLFLYWGEGSKSHATDLRLSNTDPSMIKFFIKWLTVCLQVPKSKLKVQLHLYSDMHIDKEINFWSNTLNIPDTQFIKPYIKTSLLTDINHKGGFGHGTCNIKIGNARLSEKILMTLKVITDKYTKLRL